MCCVISLFSVKTFSVMYGHAIFLCLQITKSDIRPQVKVAVSPMIADGHFNLPQELVLLCMGSHTHFNHLEDTQ